MQARFSAPVTPGSPDRVAINDKVDPARFCPVSQKTPINQGQCVEAFTQFKKNLAELITKSQGAAEKTKGLDLTCLKTPSAPSCANAPAQLMPVIAAAYAAEKNVEQGFQQLAALAAEIIKRGKAHDLLYKTKEQELSKALMDTNRFYRGSKNLSAADHAVLEAKYKAQTTRDGMIAHTYFGTFSISQAWSNLNGSLPSDPRSDQDLKLIPSDKGPLKIELARLIQTAETFATQARCQALTSQMKQQDLEAISAQLKLDVRNLVSVDRNGQVIPKPGSTITGPLDDPNAGRRPPGALDMTGQGPGGGPPKTDSGPRSGAGGQTDPIAGMSDMLSKLASAAGQFAKKPDGGSQPALAKPASLALASATTRQAATLPLKTAQAESYRFDSPGSGGAVASLLSLVDTNRTASIGGSDQSSRVNGDTGAASMTNGSEKTKQDGNVSGAGQTVAAAVGTVKGGGAASLGGTSSTASCKGKVCTEEEKQAGMSASGSAGGMAAGANGSSGSSLSQNSGGSGSSKPSFAPLPPLPPLESFTSLAPLPPLPPIPSLGDPNFAKPPSSSSPRLSGGNPALEVAAIFASGEATAANAGGVKAFEVDPATGQPKELKGNSNYGYGFSDEKISLMPRADSEPLFERVHRSLERVQKHATSGGFSL